MKATANLPRLLSALQMAFATRSSAALEVLQNGRRAGATMMDVSLVFDGLQEVLTIKDNGVGIDDFTKLFHIAESGWSKTVQEEESPFGLGFLAAVLSSDSVSILSKGKRLDLECVKFCAALDIPDLKEEPTPEGWSTVIVLRGKEGFCGIRYQKDAFGAYRGAPGHVEMESLLVGFPVEVTFNSEKVFRQAAINGTLADRFEEFDAGHLCLSGVNTFQVYLQGVQVNHSFWPWRGAFGNFSALSPWLPMEVVGPRSYPLSFDGSIIHLDPRKFKGVMPERRVLHDSAAAYARISADLSRHIRKKMLVAKEKMADLPDLFAAVFWSLAEMTNNLDILNDVPYLPYSVLGEPEALLNKPEARSSLDVSYRLPPMKWPEGQDEVTTDVLVETYRKYRAEGGSSWAVSIEDIKTGKVKLVSRPAHYRPECCAYQASMAMEAISTKVGALVIREDMPGISTKEVAGYDVLKGLPIPSIQTDVFQGCRRPADDHEVFGKEVPGICSLEDLLKAAKVTGKYLLVPYTDDYLNCVFLVCEEVTVPSPWGECIISDLPVDAGEVLLDPADDASSRLVFVPAKASNYGIPGSLAAYTNDGDVCEEALSTAEDRVNTRISLARQELGIQEKTDVVEMLVLRSIEDSNLLGDVRDMLANQKFVLTFSEDGRIATVVRD